MYSYIRHVWCMGTYEYIKDMNCMPTNIGYDGNIQCESAIFAARPSGHGQCWWCSQSFQPGGPLISEVDDIPTQIWGFPRLGLPNNGWLISWKIPLK